MGRPSFAAVLAALCMSLFACDLGNGEDRNGDGIPDGVPDPSPAPPPSDPDVAGRSIGAAGGGLDSSDGQFHIIIPAGALNSTIEISIERFDRSQVDGDIEALTPIDAYEFVTPPTDLVDPARIEFEQQPADVDADGTTTADAGPIVFQATDGTLAGLDTTTEIDGATREVTTRASIDPLAPGVFSRVAPDPRYDPTKPATSYPTGDARSPPVETSFDYPRSLQVGERGDATFSYQVGSASAPLVFEGTVNLSYRLLKPQVSGDVDILQADGERSFSLARAGGQQQGRANIVVQCVREGRASYVLEALFRHGLSGLFARAPDSLADRAFDRALADADGDLTIRLRTVEIECRAAPPAEPTFTPVGPPSTLDAIIGPIIVPGGDGSDGLLGTGTGGAAVLSRQGDGYTTDRSYDFTTVPGASTSFNGGLLLYLPGGTGNPTLILNQNSVRALLQPIDAGTGAPIGEPVFVSGTDQGFGPVGLFNRDDARPTEFYERTSSRFVVGGGTDPGNVQVRRLASDGRSTEVVREVALPLVAEENLSTAAVLGVVPSSDLRHVLYETLFQDPVTRATNYRLRLADYTGATPTSTLIDTLGNNSQRFVCDAASGVCAVSNCTSPNDFVQVYRWDGAGSVQVGPRVSVPVDCAFALDVRGNRIFVAGFNDARYSVGTVDLENGLATTFTPAVALPSGCAAPNGARLLNDADGAAVVSCGGSSPGVARVPNVLAP